MNELITVIITVITGVSIFVLGQIIINFWLMPIKKHKEVIGEIQDAIIFYANVFSPMMDKKTQDEARENFRKLSTQLVSTARVVPTHHISCFIFGLPSIDQVQKAHHSLIGLSNSVGYERDAYKVMDDLKSELNLWFINDES